MEAEKQDHIYAEGAQDQREEVNSKTAPSLCVDRPDSWYLEADFPDKKKVCVNRDG